MLFAALFLAIVPGDAPIQGVVHRPQYHLIPQGTEAGWISDPNGPIYANGKQRVCPDGFKCCSNADVRHQDPFTPPFLSAEK